MFRFQTLLSTSTCATTTGATTGRLAAPAAKPRRRENFAAGPCRLSPGTPWLTAVDPTLAFRDFQLLKLKCDELLSNFACFGFKCNLRHYFVAAFAQAQEASRLGVEAAKQRGQRQGGAGRQYQNPC